MTLIVFEGVSGSGKSTLIRSVRNSLKDDYSIKVIHSSAVFKKYSTADWMAYFLGLKKQIVAALKKYQLVLLDRYVLSFWVYNVDSKGVEEYLYNINMPVASLSFLLRCELTVAYLRKILRMRKNEELDCDEFYNSFVRYQDILTTPFEGKNVFEVVTHGSSYFYSEPVIRRIKKDLERADIEDSVDYWRVVAQSLSLS